MVDVAVGNALVDVGKVCRSVVITAYWPHYGLVRRGRLRYRLVVCLLVVSQCHRPLEGEESRLREEELESVEEAVRSPPDGGRGLEVMGQLGVPLKISRDQIVEKEKDDKRSEKRRPKSFG